VYDFQVADDETFSCAGVVVHNCNFGMLEDTLNSILNGVREVGILSKYGAGVAMNFSELRPAGSSISSGGKSEGIIPFIQLYDTLIQKISQNSTRRGFLTAYLSADHDEILDFLDIGAEKSEIQKITTAVTIPKGWMQSLKEGNPKNRQVWAKILERRSEFGYPYILFEENCNNENAPQIYRDKGLWLYSSNICSECTEYCDAEKTFACCLSSVNLYFYDDWKSDPDFIFDMNLMLDCVIEEYITKAKNYQGLGRARKFAEEHRAIGLGVLGFHSLLQKKSIPFGSMESFLLNNEIFKSMREESDRASRWMAENWGEPKFMKGSGYRNSSRMAIAPTKSTAFIMGGGKYSSSIEPIKNNYHEKSLAKIQVEYKNPELVECLNKYEKNTPDVWKSILMNNGSVQHLTFMSDHDKSVFKTFPEISQMDIIKLAAQRQKYIDQGQSLNIMFATTASPKDMHKLHMEAYDSGIKTLYYQYTVNVVQEFNAKLLECSACDG
jgi:ribonucleoside-diphosphate reductase alpha chain